MAKNEETQNEELIVDVVETYSKTEKYIEENKNSLTIIIGAIVLIVGCYFGYKNLYVAPMEKEAQEQMWKAEQYFEQDSFRLAINGDGNYFGFLHIADNYGATKAGNLANYYLGISHLNLGEFDLAIDYLKSFDSSDQLVGPVATGAIGDAYMELGNVDEALSFYKKAAAQKENTFTAPMFLMKAAFAHELQNDYSSSLDIYKKIQKDFPNSKEARNADKYVARAEAKLNS